MLSDSEDSEGSSEEGTIERILSSSYSDSETSDDGGEVKEERKKARKRIVKLRRRKVCVECVRLRQRGGPPGRKCRECLDKAAKNKLKNDRDGAKPGFHLWKSVGERLKEKLTREGVSALGYKSVGLPWLRPYMVAGFALPTGRYLDGWHIDMKDKSPKEFDLSQFRLYYNDREVDLQRRDTWVGVPRRATPASQNPGLPRARASSKMTRKKKSQRKFLKRSRNGDEDDDDNTGDRKRRRVD